MEQFASQLDPHLKYWKRPWLNQTEQPEPRKTLTPQQVIQIEQACEREIDLIVTSIERGNRLIDANRDQIPSDPEDVSAYEDLGVCLATIAYQYGGVIPKAHELRTQNRALGKALKYYHKYRELESLLCGSPRAMVPFVVLLAHRTGFNPDTVLGLSWSQVRESNWFYGDERWDIDPSGEEDRVTIVGKKGRSLRAQVRSFPARVTTSTNPPVVLRKLKIVTSRLRPHAPAFFADRLFLFSRLQSQHRGVTGYGVGRDSLACDICWTRHLKSFIRENRLPAFTLMMLRRTSSDLVDEVTGGDIIAKQTILNHHDPNTTYTHYQSATARQRYNETLAGIQGERVRWVETGGRRDVRGIGRLSTRRAVTPGFECLDPFDSPQPNQEPGKLCDAYLACPRCPMAAVNRRDPDALSSLIQLEAALLGAQTQVTAYRWLEVLEPLLQIIRQDWLPLFPEGTWREAETTNSGLLSVVVE
jgi:hypothetical protein